jgi:hypothetical protein
VAVADLRAVAAAADEAVTGTGVAAGTEAGAADKVGGIGASPDPRLEASNIGDAHVPEYALSVDVDAACEALVEPLELLDGVASAAGAAVVLDAFVAVVAGSVDERPVVFAAVGLDACPEVAGGVGLMPNPAGVLGVAIAEGALGPAAF